MATKPTQDIAGFAASGVVATTIPPGELAIGYQAEKDVPAAWLNLFARWADFFRSGGGFVRLNPGSMVATFATGITVTRSLSGQTIINNPTGGSLSAYIHAGVVNAPGTLASVTVEFDSGTTAASATLQPIIRWSLGTGALDSRIARCASATIAGSGRQTFAYTATGSDTNNIGGPWSLELHATLQAGDTIEYGVATGIVVALS